MKTYDDVFCEFLDKLLPQEVVDLAGMDLRLKEEIIKLAVERSEDERNEEM